MDYISSIASDSEQSNGSAKPWSASKMEGDNDYDDVDGDGDDDYDDDRKPAARAPGIVTPDQNSPLIVIDSSDDDDEVELVEHMEAVAPPVASAPGRKKRPQVIDCNNDHDDYESDNQNYVAPEGIVIDEDDEGNKLFMIDSIQGYRHRRGHEEEWLVSWYGCDESNWEPDSHLCDSAKKEADIFRATIEGRSPGAAIDLSWDEYQGRKSARRRTFARRTGKTKKPRPGKRAKITAPVGTGAVEKVIDYKKGKECDLFKVVWKDQYPDEWLPRRFLLDPDTKKQALAIKKAKMTKIQEEESPLEMLETSPFTASLIQHPRADQQPMAIPVAFLMDTKRLKKENNFLELFVGSRHIQPVVLKMGNSIHFNHQNIPTERCDNGKRYALIASKAKRDRGGNQSWARQTEIEFKYVALEEEEEEQEQQQNGRRKSWDPQAELAKIADFRSLPSHKIASRLELFMTPAKDENLIFPRLASNNFELIPNENCHMGCGFIPEDFIKFLFPTKYRQIVGLQVRIFAPRIGVAKGMLMKKRGIAKVLLPPSMLKVGPSSRCNDNWAVMVVKATSPSDRSEQFGKYLDPDPGRKPRASFQDELRRLDGMHEHLFRGLGVPKSTMARYTRNSYLLKHKKHIYLNGVCDPTGHLPEGSIFITGYCKNERGNRKHFSQVHEKMLVTRSPCLEPTDAKLLPVVGNKPIHMPQDEWNWLLDLPFGVIIFARARPENRENCAPTPMMVADGDLDGDLYMILFDEELRKSLDQAFEDPRMIAAIQRQEDDVRNQRINCKEGPPVGENGPADWFHQAQLEMVKFDRKAIIGKATGTLYKASHRIANDSKDGIWHPDAIACARGFKQALDAPKHGNLIELPSRLKTSTSNATKSIKSIHECISWT